MFTNHFAGRDKPHEAQAQDVLDVVFNGILSDEQCAKVEVFVQRMVLTQVMYEYAAGSHFGITAGQWERWQRQWPRDGCGRGSFSAGADGAVRDSRAEAHACGGIGCRGSGRGVAGGHSAHQLHAASRFDG